MAVTVLVSVARALEQLHRAGFAHDRITPACVIIDGTGRPVLIGLGHIRRIPAQTDAAAAQRLADYARFALLVTRVFETVGDVLARDRGENIADWLASLPGSEGMGEQRAAGELAAEVEDRLFAVARPRPLGTRPSAERTTTSGSARDSPVKDTEEQRPAAVLRRKSAPRRDRRAAAEAVRGGSSTREGDAAPREVRTRPLMRILGAAVGVVVAGGAIQRVRARLGAVLRARRRPLIVGAGVGGALLVLVLALTPPGTAVGDAEGSRIAGRGRSPSRSRRRNRLLPPRVPTRTRPRPRTIPLPQPRPCSPSVVSACARCRSNVLTASISSHRRCSTPTRARSVDSSMTPMRLARTTMPTFTASLIQRSGGSALIALAPPTDATAGDADTATPKPASALVIEAETGWRLRRS